ncbi:MAG TPA: adenylate/guanylate cyclase domain-containing protein [Flavisolibacter sp.]|nr:adenylate/guanylate cyclase domain-containing protein [Flavisolibacter sp.]
MPRKLFFYRLRTLAAISLVWIVFGVVFFINLVKPSNDLGVEVSLFQFCLTFGLAGFIISAALIYVLKPAFNHQPVWLAIILKLAFTLLLFFLIAFILLMLYYFLNYQSSLQQYFSSFFTRFVHTNTFTGFITDLGLMTLVSIILLEVTDKYGPGMFWSMLRGEYHKPRIENRIFIFLDINESTSIAEQLGHEEYFRMLRSFFNDITVPLMSNDGEIYQYVGDEIVISWLNTPENKIKSLKFIRNTYYFIERLGDRYRKRYGKQPRFKAGVHAGEVTAGFIGIIKKDLIYCGDTMNTTARIRSMCNELEEPFILSEDFMQDFHQPFGYEIGKIGTMELKGRSEPIKLFSLKFDS